MKKFVAPMKRLRAWAASILLAALGVAQAAHAEDPRAVDGDTLRIGVVSIRLYGIDAPEMKQTCGDWPAGELAQEALASMVIGRKVDCVSKAHDRYGRMVAVCTVDGVDIGAEMVRSGMAWAFSRYSVIYLDQQAEAKTANRGVHQYDCEPAWAYRARLNLQR